MNTEKLQNVRTKHRSHALVRLPTNDQHTSREGSARRCTPRITKEEKKADIWDSPDAGCNDPGGHCYCCLRDAYGRDLRHMVRAPPIPTRGWEALREKPRESSEPGSCKSGDRLPRGVGVLS